MPFRGATTNPTIIAGTNISGVGINTGQINYTLGGQRTFTKYSGTAGGDAAIWVGPGRLDGAMLFDGSLLALSGTPLIFYDSAVAVSGGPLAASGHKVVGVLGPSSLGKVTMASGDVLQAGLTVSIMAPFNSGLCFSSRSGHLGMSCHFTPVVSG